MAIDISSFGKKPGLRSGRSSVGRMLSLREDEWEILDALAKERGLTRSELVRRLVGDALDDRESLHAAWLAGFMSACEGWNGEYPFCNGEWDKVSPLPGRVRRMTRKFFELEEQFNEWLERWKSR